MAFSSVNMDSLCRAMQGTAFGTAERCVPFLASGLGALDINDGKTAFEDLRKETLEARGQYDSAEDEMDWEPSEPTVLFDFNTVRQSVPFGDTSAVAKPFNPFQGQVSAFDNSFSTTPSAQPFNPSEVKGEADATVMTFSKVNPFPEQPVAANCSLPVDMDIDEWSLSDKKPVKTQRPAANNQRGNNRNGKPGNCGNHKGNNNGNNNNQKPTRNVNGGNNNQNKSARNVNGGHNGPNNQGRRANVNNSAANGRKPAAGPAVAMLGNHKVAAAPAARQDQDGSNNNSKSRRDARPRAKNNNKPSGRQQSQGTKNRNQRR